MVVRRIFFFVSIFVFFLIFLVGVIWPFAFWMLLVAIPLFLLGLVDITQTRSNVLRNYPVVGHFRYMMEGIRPQIRQYFIEDNVVETPFSREQRELVYERAAKTVDTIPFGTLKDVYATGYEWIEHSLAPKPAVTHEMKVWVGGPACKQPYLASRLNISALSFGALSKNAILALNRGARLGKFAHNTGEGGLTQYHLQEGGDLIWQIGTGYFGCRNLDGSFNAEEFAKKAQLPNVKMVEIKLSQGAKPSHGGILPAHKITKEISEMRGVPMGEDCVSPPAHTEFSTPIGLLEFVQRLRDLSGGKPTGFKLCLGIFKEFMGICKAMLETGIMPDFIAVDGSEGGTGAAPLEFTESIGTPLNEALIFIHNCLVGINVRQHIRIIASGKIVSGFDITTKIALGADMCNAARPMMFALGCVQSRRCHNNTCPTGVATQDPQRVYALKVDEKSRNVRNYHDATLQSFRDVLGAAGLEKPEDLKAWHIGRRVTETDARRYTEIYTYLKPGDLLKDEILDKYSYSWKAASPYQF